MKHAYLIMAHGNWEILKKLLELLDDEKHDIFLHIDAMKTMPKECYNILKKSELVIIKSRKIYWADFSLVETTLDLLETALKKGKYSYYHLLSGTDMPLKSNKERYNFFENSQKEFVGIVPKEVYYSVRRVKFYHPFVHCTRYRKSKTLKALDRLFEYIQKIMRVNRLVGNCWKIIDGWEWFSITETFCKYIIEQKEIIVKMFSSSIASDELFVQTLAYNSQFYNSLYDVTDLKKGSMRFIDWDRGTPYTWGMEESDYDVLINSPYMFARKFDEKYFDIVERIYEEVNRRNKEDDQ